MSLSKTWTLSGKSNFNMNSLNPLILTIRKMRKKVNSTFSKGLSRFLLILDIY